MEIPAGFWGKALAGSQCNSNVALHKGWRYSGTISETCSTAEDYRRNQNNNQDILMHVVFMCQNAYMIVIV